MKQEVIHTRVSSEMAAQLRQVAAEMDIPLSIWIRWTISEKLAQMQRGEVLPFPTPASTPNGHVYGPTVSRHTPIADLKGPNGEELSLTEKVELRKAERLRQEGTLSLSNGSR